MSPRCALRRIFLAAACCALAATLSAAQPARHDAVSRALYELADELERNGRWEAGMRLLAAAIEALSGEPDGSLAIARLQVAQAKITRARSFYHNAGFAETQELLLRACAAAEARKDRKLLADCLHQTGASQYTQALWSEKPDFSAALENHRRSLAIRRDIRDARGIAESLFSLGLLRERAGDPAGALRLYEESLAISRPRAFRVEMSYAIRHVAGIAEERGELDSALALFRESLALREASGFRVGVPFAHLAVGDVLRKTGEAGEAAAHYEKALALAQELDLKVAVVFAHIALGELQAASARPGEASRSYENALAASRAFGFEPGVRQSEEALKKLEAR